MFFLRSVEHFAVEGVDIEQEELHEDCFQSGEMVLLAFLLGLFEMLAHHCHFEGVAELGGGGVAVVVEV